MAHEGPPKPALVTDDRFTSVVRRYMESSNFKELSEGTKDLWGRELRLAAHPDSLGSVSIQEMRPKLVQAFLDGISDRPSKQQSALSALKQLEKWAIVRDYLPRQITLGVETKEAKGGHIPWTQQQVELAEKYARPDLARAITLAANTGQRGSDLVRMGWGDIETFDGVKGINVRQRKTGREVWIPITSTLAAAMAKWERRPGPILTKLDGRAWLRRDLTMAWTLHRTTNRNLEELWYLGPNHDQPARLHGLRGFACVQLLRAGANTRQVSDMVGMSEPMVANYTRFSVQKANAVAAVVHLEKTIQERAARLTARMGS
jgi:integrase